MTSLAGSTAPISLPPLASRAIRASLWTVGGYGLSQLLRLAGNIVLARVLFPQAFGLMALIQVFLRGLQMFSDLGVGLSVIREHRNDSVFLNTAWTAQALR